MDKRYWKYLSEAKWVGKYIPLWVKSLIRRHCILATYDRYKFAQSDPFNELRNGASYKSEYPYTVGIIKELAHFHQYYVAACREMKVSYKLLDISDSKWIDVVQNSCCDAFLVWPSAFLTICKQMYDERLKIMVDDLSKIIYPSYNEIWLYENKRRMRDWLLAHDIPHPETEVFYDVDHALDYLNNAELPLVLKTNHGASSKGVIILRDRKSAKKNIVKSFKRGLVVKNGDPRDRQWGSVIIQKYYPCVNEWRMVRIGDSFFGHPKGRVGDFHSGSGKVRWDTPPLRLLDFTREVTNIGRFTSMDVDIFETLEGRYLVNELQTVFGASYCKDQLKVNGKVGRYIYNEAERSWFFEDGDFARNACANLRVNYLITQLQIQQKVA